jgi:oxygen-independent coproporphyrinogen-3 oxidase
METAASAMHYLRPGSLMLPALPPLSIYVHLPWCLKKCPYCDFNSHEVRSANKLEDALQSRYIDALILDAESALPLVWGRPIHSIFMGGGTPSLFAPAQIERLSAALRARFPLTADCEITLEANPGTFETDRFAAYRAAGVTRLSVGVQSFADAKLQAIGRVHNAAQARAALAEAAQHFEHFNLDLMYALPGQSLAELQADVQTALSFAPPHLSIYHLTLEPNTYFAKFPPALPDEDVAWQMLDAITEATQAAGLARYEVSAFARGAGQQCRHNRNYWQFGDYLGIGAGAHGKISFPHRVLRQVRYRTPSEYLAQAERGHFVAQENEIARADLPFEFMLNALRLVDGFAVQDFTERTGLALTAIEKPLQLAEAKGLITRDWQRIAPTTRGLDFLSELQELFLPETD